MLVASVGIYGVVACAVTRRRNEIGIRMALGAKRGEVMLMLLRQGMTPVLLGIGAGIFQGLVMAETVRSLLFGVQPDNPAIIGAVAAMLMIVGIAACLIPAHRATTLNTLEVLRQD